MTRLLTSLLLVSTFQTFGPYRAEGAFPDRPSILLVTIDTLRPDHLPFHGYPEPTAPFLTSLAESSFVFTRAYSTSSWTAPAMASMVTGVQPASHGVIHGTVTRGVLKGQETLPPALPTLAGELKGLGYRTYAVTANPHLRADLGFGKGFDRYQDLGFSPAEKVNEALLAWKAEIEAESRPVFIWLHYFDPHHPYFRREVWLQDHPAGFTPEEEAAWKNVEEDWTAWKARVRKGGRPLELARLFYDSEIRYLDDHLREIFARIPRLSGCFTLVTADHGEEFLEHGSLGHSNNLYQETVRIPFLIRPPGGCPGQAIDHVVSLVDVAPTLLSVAGGTSPAGWAGVSLWQGDGPLTPARSFVLAELDRHPREAGLRALIGERWKLITRIRASWSELYDLQTDPLERKNVARRESGQARLMRTALAGLVRSLPPPPPAPARAMSEEEEERLRRLGYAN